MSIVPLRWLGNRRADALRDLLQARLAGWLTAWSGPGCDFVLEKEWPEAGRFDRGGRWHAVDLDGGRVALWLPDGVEAQFGARLPGVSAVGDAGLAAGVGRRALEDAARTLVGRPQARFEPCVEAWPEAMLDRRRGGLMLRWSFVQSSIWIHLDANSCDLLVPARTHARSRLDSRKDALGRSDVALEVVLDLGDAVLADLTQLRPGNVLRTTAPVDSVLKLVAPGGAVVATGSLAVQNERRAIRFRHFKQQGK